MLIQPCDDLASRLRGCSRFSLCDERLLCYPVAKSVVNPAYFLSILTICWLQVYNICSPNLSVLSVHLAHRGDLLHVNSSTHVPNNTKLVIQPLNKHSLGPAIVFGVMAVTDNRLYLYWKNPGLILSPPPSIQGACVSLGLECKKCICELNYIAGSRTF